MKIAVAAHVQRDLRTLLTSPQPISKASLTALFGRVISQAQDVSI
jgi:hypothetical protein